MYIGCTKSLEQRLTLHNKGQVPATQGRAPFNLVHYEAFINRQDAFEREQWLKTGWGRNQVKKMLSNYLKSLGG